ncbi:MAG: hypothetical protein H7A21_10200 [Spirochaetales bacterium]|nr:hypothetical protein [Leptospiraceae bacterium]MCP5481795.1 hypothetical protein [Spirochaetales bacterium]MCP5486911.1 hypothetical protein [Spirochaetales bacterium]
MLPANDWRVATSAILIGSGAGVFLAAGARWMLEPLHQPAAFPIADWAVGMLAGLIAGEIRPVAAQWRLRCVLGALTYLMAFTAILFARGEPLLPGGGLVLQAVSLIVVCYRIAAFGGGGPPAVSGDRLP